MKRAWNWCPLAAVLALGTWASTSQADFTLTILHNNDGESSVLPVLDPVGGAAFGEISDAARFVTLVNDQKATSTNPILLSSGDNFLAGPNLNASFGDGIFYDALLLDKIGYDALAIGNHEFDFGTQVLADFISDSTGSYPFLSANLDFPASSPLNPLVGSRIQKSTVLNVGGEQVGIIGATTPTLASISQPGDTVIGQDVVGAVQSEVTALQGAGVNKIILISHLQGISEDINLIGQLSGVDVVIAGGGDEILDSGDSSNLLPSQAGSPLLGDYPLSSILDFDNKAVPVVTTPGRYDYLGKLVVNFDDGGNFLSVGTGSELIRVAAADGLTPDSGVLSEIQAPIESFLATASPIGSTDTTLSFLRSDVRSRSTNFGALTTDAYLALGKAEAPGLGVTDPIIAIQNGGGIRDDNIPSPFFAGQELLDLDIRNVLPFDNDVVLIEGFDTSRLLALLEEAVDSIPGASGGFAHVGGFHFTFDPNAPDDSRVVDVHVEGVGQVIDDGAVVIDQSFALVTNSFSWSQNGDDYPLMDLPATVILDGDAGSPGYAQAVIDFIQNELGGVVPAHLYAQSAVESRIRQVPEPATFSLLLIAGIGLGFRRIKRV